MLDPFDPRKKIVDLGQPTPVPAGLYSQYIQQFMEQKYGPQTQEQQALGELAPVATATGLGDNYVPYLDRIQQQEQEEKALEKLGVKSGQAGEEDLIYFRDGSYVKTSDYESAFTSGPEDPFRTPGLLERSVNAVAQPVSSLMNFVGGGLNAVSTAAGAVKSAIYPDVVEETLRQNAQYVKGSLDGLAQRLDPKNPFHRVAYEAVRALTAIPLTAAQAVLPEGSVTPLIDEYLSVLDKAQERYSTIASKIAGKTDLAELAYQGISSLTDMLVAAGLTAAAVGGGGSTVPQAAASATGAASKALGILKTLTGGAAGVKNFASFMGAMSPSIYQQTRSEMERMGLSPESASREAYNQLASEFLVTALFSTFMSGVEPALRSSAVRKVINISAKESAQKAIPAISNVLDELYKRHPFSYAVTAELLKRNAEEIPEEVATSLIQESQTKRALGKSGELSYDEIKRIAAETIFSTIVATSAFDAPSAGLTGMEARRTALSKDYADRLYNAYVSMEDVKALYDSWLKGDPNALPSLSSLLHTMVSRKETAASEESPLPETSFLQGVGGKASMAVSASPIGPAPVFAQADPQRIVQSAIATLQNAAETGSDTVREKASQYLNAIREYAQQGNITAAATIAASIVTPEGAFIQSTEPGPGEKPFLGVMSLRQNKEGLVRSQTPVHEAVHMAIKNFMTKEEYDQAAEIFRSEDGRMDEEQFVDAFFDWLAQESWVKEKGNVFDRLYSKYRDKIAAGVDKRVGAALQAFKKIESGDIFTRDVTSAEELTRRVGHRQGIDAITLVSEKLDQGLVDVISHALNMTDPESRIADMLSDKAHPVRLFLKDAFNKIDSKATRLVATAAAIDALSGNDVSNYPEWARQFGETISALSNYYDSNTREAIANTRFNREWFSAEGGVVEKAAQRWQPSKMPQPMEQMVEGETKQPGEVDEKEARRATREEDYQKRLQAKEAHQRAMNEEKLRFKEAMAEIQKRVLSAQLEYENARRKAATEAQSAAARDKAMSAVMKALAKSVEYAAKAAARETEEMAKARASAEKESQKRQTEWTKADATARSEEEKRKTIEAKTKAFQKKEAAKRKTIKLELDAFRKSEAAKRLTIRQRAIAEIAIATERLVAHIEKTKQDIAKINAAAEARLKVSSQRAVARANEVLAALSESGPESEKSAIDSIADAVLEAAQSAQEGDSPARVLESSTEAMETISSIVKMAVEGGAESMSDEDLESIRDAVVSMVEQIEFQAEEEAEPEGAPQQQDELERALILGRRQAEPEEKEAQETLEEDEYEREDEAEADARKRVAAASRVYEASEEIDRISGRGIGQNEEPLTTGDSGGTILKQSLPPAMRALLENASYDNPKAFAKAVKEASDHIESVINNVEALFEDGKIMKEVYRQASIDATLIMEAIDEYASAYKDGLIDAEEAARLTTNAVIAYRSIMMRFKGIDSIVPSTIFGIDYSVSADFTFSLDSDVKPLLDGLRVMAGEEVFSHIVNMGIKFGKAEKFSITPGKGGTFYYSAVARKPGKLSVDGKKARRALFTAVPLVFKSLTDAKATDETLYQKVGAAIADAIVLGKEKVGGVAASVEGFWQSIERAQAEYRAGKKSSSKLTFQATVAPVKRAVESTLGKTLTPEETYLLGEMYYSAIDRIQDLDYGGPDEYTVSGLTRGNYHFILTSVWSGRDIVGLESDRPTDGTWGVALYDPLADSTTGTKGGYRVLKTFRGVSSDTLSMTASMVSRDIAKRVLGKRDVSYDDVSKAARQLLEAVKSEESWIAEKFGGVLGLDPKNAPRESLEKAKAAIESLRKEYEDRFEKPRKEFRKAAESFRKRRNKGDEDAYRSLLNAFSLVLTGEYVKTTNEDRSKIPFSRHAQAVMLRALEKMGPISKEDILSAVDEIEISEDAAEYLDDMFKYKSSVVKDSLISFDELERPSSIERTEESTPLRVRPVDYDQGVAAASYVTTFLLTDGYLVNHGFLNGEPMFSINPHLRDALLKTGAYKPSLDVVLDGMTVGEATEEWAMAPVIEQAREWAKNAGSIVLDPSVMLLFKAIQEEEKGEKKGEGKSKNAEKAIRTIDEVPARTTDKSTGEGFGDRFLSVYQTGVAGTVIEDEHGGKYEKGLAGVVEMIRRGYTGKVPGVENMIPNEWIMGVTLESMLGAPSLKHNVFGLLSNITLELLSLAEIANAAGISYEHLVRHSERMGWTKGEKINPFSYFRSFFNMAEEDKNRFYEYVRSGAWQDDQRFYPRSIGGMALKMLKDSMEKIDRFDSLSKKEQAELGNYLLSGNRKSNRSVDTMLGTCLPSTACKTCYAGSGVVRDGRIARTVAITLLQYYNPETYARAIAAYVKTVPKTEMPFLRWNGAGDSLYEFQVRAFNKYVEVADRSVHVFSRSVIRRIPGTYCLQDLSNGRIARKADGSIDYENSVFVFKEGSLDAGLFEFYVKTFGGVDEATAFLKSLLTDRGIVNSYLFTNSEHDRAILKHLRANNVPLVVHASRTTEVDRKSVMEDYLSLVEDDYGKDPYFICACSADAITNNKNCPGCFNSHASACFMARMALGLTESGKIEFIGSVDPVTGRIAPPTLLERVAAIRRGVHPAALIGIDPDVFGLPGNVMAVSLKFDDIAERLLSKIKAASKGNKFKVAVTNPADKLNSIQVESLDEANNVYTAMRDMANYFASIAAHLSMRRAVRRVRQKMRVDDAAEFLTPFEKDYKDIYDAFFDQTSVGKRIIRNSFADSLFTGALMEIIVAGREGVELQDGTVVSPKEAMADLARVYSEYMEYVREVQRKWKSMDRAKRVEAPAPIEVYSSSAYKAYKSKASSHKAYVKAAIRSVLEKYGNNKVIVELMRRLAKRVNAVGPAGKVKTLSELKAAESTARFFVDFSFVINQLSEGAWEALKSYSQDPWYQRRYMPVTKKVVEKLTVTEDEIDAIAGLSDKQKNVAKSLVRFSRAVENSAWPLNFWLQMAGVSDISGLSYQDSARVSDLVMAAGTVDELKTIGSHIKYPFRPWLLFPSMAFGNYEVLSSRYPNIKKLAISSSAREPEFVTEDVAGLNYFDTDGESGPLVRMSYALVDVAAGAMDWLPYVVSKVIPHEILHYYNAVNEMGTADYMPPGERGADYLEEAIRLYRYKLLEDSRYYFDKAEADEHYDSVQERLKEIPITPLHYGLKNNAEFHSELFVDEMFRDFLFDLDMLGSAARQSFKRVKNVFSVPAIGPFGHVLASVPAAGNWFAKPFSWRNLLINSYIGTYADLHARSMNAIAELGRLKVKGLPEDFLYQSFSGKDISAIERAVAYIERLINNQHLLINYPHLLKEEDVYEVEPKKQINVKWITERPSAEERIKYEASGLALMLNDIDRDRMLRFTYTHPTSKEKVTRSIYLGRDKGALLYMLSAKFGYNVAERVLDEVFSGKTEGSFRYAPTIFPRSLWPLVYGSDFVEKHKGLKRAAENFYHFIVDAPIIYGDFMTSVNDINNYFDGDVNEALFAARAAGDAAASAYKSVADIAEGAVKGAIEGIPPWRYSPVETIPTSNMTVRSKALKASDPLDAFSNVITEVVERNDETEKLKSLSDQELDDKYLKHVKEYLSDQPIEKRAEAMVKAYLCVFEAARRKGYTFGPIYRGDEGAEDIRHYNREEYIAKMSEINEGGEFEGPEDAGTFFSVSPGTAGRYGRPRVFFMKDPRKLRVVDLVNPRELLKNMLSYKRAFNTSNPNNKDYVSMLKKIMGNDRVIGIAEKFIRESWASFVNARAITSKESVDRVFDSIIVEMASEDPRYVKLKEKVDELNKLAKDELDGKIVTPYYVATQLASGLIPRGAEKHLNNKKVKSLYETVSSVLKKDKYASIREYVEKGEYPSDGYAELYGEYFNEIIDKYEEKNGSSLYSNMPESFLEKVDALSKQLRDLVWTIAREIDEKVSKFVLADEGAPAESSVEGASFIRQEILESQLYAALEQILPNRASRGHRDAINTFRDFIAGMGWMHHRDEWYEMQRVYAALNYDAVFCQDHGGDFTIVVFNPTAIKLGNVFTYDENGRLVPPSKRFDDSKIDVDFSLDYDEEYEGDDDEGPSNRGKGYYTFSPRAASRRVFRKVSSYVMSSLTPKGWVRKPPIMAYDTKNPDVQEQNAALYDQAHAYVNAIEMGQNFEAAKAAAEAIPKSMIDAILRGAVAGEPTLTKPMTAAETLAAMARITDVGMRMIETGRNKKLFTELLTGWVVLGSAASASMNARRVPWFVGSKDVENWVIPESLFARGMQVYATGRENVSELVERINALKRELAKAAGNEEQLAKLKLEKERIEDLHKKYIQKKRKEISELRKKNEELARTLEGKLAAERAEFEKLIQEKDALINEMQAELESRSKDVKSLRQRVSRAYIRIAQIQSDISELTKELQDTIARNVDDFQRKLEEHGIIKKTQMKKYQAFKDEMASLLKDALDRARALSDDASTSLESIAQSVNDALEKSRKQRRGKSGRFGAGIDSLVSFDVSVAVDLNSDQSVPDDVADYIDRMFEDITNDHVERFAEAIKAIESDPRLQTKIARMLALKYLGQRVFIENPVIRRLALAGAKAFMLANQLTGEEGLSDAIYRWYVTSIMSSPKMLMRNLLGNATMLGIDLFVRKPVSILVSKAYAALRGSVSADEWNDYKEFLSSVPAAAEYAAQAFMETWKSGIPVYSMVLRGMTPDEAVKEAEFIKAMKVGKWPAEWWKKPLAAISNVGNGFIRLAVATDEAFKAFEHHAYFGMIAREKLRQAAVVRALYGIARDPADIFDIVNACAWDKAQVLTFTGDLPRAAQMLSNFIESFPGLRYIVPFRKTPLNILVFGMSKTLPFAMAKAMKTLSDKNAAPSEKVEALTWLVISVAVTGMAAAITMGDDDDDEEKALPRFTGTVPVKVLSREENELRRVIAPSASVRIGNNYVSYREIDPFSTIFTNSIDLVRSFKRAVKSGNVNGIIDAAGKYLQQTIEGGLDRSYFESLYSAYENLFDSERRWTFAGGIMTGFVPTYVRNIMSDPDPVVRTAVPGLQHTSVLRRVAPFTLPARRYVTGLEMKKATYTGNERIDGFIRLINPFYVVNIPARLEGEIYKKTYGYVEKNRGLETFIQPRFITPPSARGRYEGRDYQLGPRQYETLLNAYRFYMARNAGKINSWLRLSDDEFVRRMNALAQKGLDWARTRPSVKRAIKSGTPL